MIRRNFFKFAMIFSIGLSILISTAQAEIKTYIGVGEYFMSDFETLDIAKQRAKAYAQRDAQEQAGIYIQSYSRMENFKLIDDEIVTMTNGILKVLKTDYQTLTTNEGAGVKIRATIEANIETSEINKWLDRSVQERSTLVNQNKELQKAVNEQEKTIADLKRQLAESKKSQKIDKIVAGKFAEADKDFLSNQKVDDGNKCYINGEIEKALAYYNEALKLNPKNVIALSNIAAICNDLDDYNNALEKSNSAIKIDPNYSLSYYNRALAYLNTQNYDQATKDFSKAIELDKNFIAAYNNRGLSRYYSQDINGALEDFNKAISINKNFAEAYSNRAMVYLTKNDFKRALDDCNIATQLQPNYAIAHYNRGNANINLGDFNSAVADYSKAINLNENFAIAYYNRAVAYSALQNYDLSIKDFTTFINFNPNFAQAYYFRGLCYKELGNNSAAENDLMKAKQLGYNF